MDLLLDTHAFLWFVHPFDRLLVAQTVTEGLHLISADTTLDSYHVTRIW